MRDFTTLSRFRSLGRFKLGGLLGLFLLSLSCGREITGPSGALTVSAPLALLTQFPALPGQASLESGVEFARMRATLIRLNGSIALDRTVDFPSSADSISLDLKATLGPAATDEGEEMILRLRLITATGDTVFQSGPDSVFVEAMRSGATPTVIVVDLSYVGPGSNATRVEFSQSDVTVLGVAGTLLTAQAFDGQNAPVPSAPILFSSNDTTLVKFADPRSGNATTFLRRDSTLVFASLLTGPSDTALVRVTLPASAIAPLSGDFQTAAISTTLAAPVTVRVTASDNVAVPGVAVTFATTDGSVGAASVLTDVNGEASTAWTLGATIGTQSLTASVAGLTGSPVTFTATAVSGAAVSLEITDQPQSAVAGTTLGSITVTARDGQSNVATEFTDSVTISIGANAGGGTLSGTRTVAAVAGVATFTDLNIDRSGTGYTLVASAAGLSDGVSATFNVTHAAAVTLAFVTQPATVAVGAPLTPPVEVEAQDAFGNRATDFTGNITIALDANPGAATLGGTATVAAVLGVATFNDLTLDAIAAGYTLVATAAGLADANSATFNTVAELNAWTNVAGGLWSNTANWSLGRVPSATDSVVIALPGTYTVTLDSDFAGSFVDLGAVTGTQTLAMSGRTLALDGQLSTQGGGTVNAFNSTLAGSGSIHNAGTLLLRDVDVNVPLANGGLVVGNSTVSFAEPVTTNGSSVIRAQPDGSSGIATLNFLAGLSNFGTLDLTSTAGAYSAAATVSGGSLVNEASGVIRSQVGTGGARTLTAQVLNAGSIIVDQPLTWNGISATQQNTGSIAVNANLNVAQTGTTPSFVNNGSVVVAATRAFALIGGSFIESAAGLSGSGIVAFTNTTVQLLAPFATNGLFVSAIGATFTGGGSLEVSADDTLSIRGSSIALPFTNTSTLLLDGTNTITGAVTTTPASLMQFAASGSTGFATLNTAGFTNLGAIELTAPISGYAAQLNVTSGVLVNAASGSISSLVGSGGTRAIVGAVENNGSILVLQPSSWSASNVPIANHGTLDVSAANLTMTLTGTASFLTTGTVNIAATRTLQISGGTVAQDGGAFTGTGQLVLLNSTLAGPGTFVNPSARTVFMRGVTATAAIVNQGTLIADGANNWQAALTAPVGSVLRVQPTGSTGSSVLTVASGFTNDGTIELTAVDGAYAATLVVSSGTLVNAASGVITTVVGSGGARTITAEVENFGSIVVNQPLAWNGVSAAQVNDGSIAANANITLTQTGTTPSFTNLGALDIAAARSFVVNGGAFSQTPSSISGTGTLAFQNTAVEFAAPFVSGALTLAVSNSTVSGAGSLTNSAGSTLAMLNSNITLPLTNEGVLTSDGNGSITGTLSAPVGSIIRVLPTGSTGFSNLSVAGFVNNGDIELTSSVSGYSSTLTVASGTLVNAVGASISSLVGTLGSRSIVGSVDNQGSIIVNHGLAWTANNVNVTNAGSINLVGGSLTVSQTGSALFTLTGTVDIAAGRQMTVSGGNFAQDGGAVTGAGTLGLSGLTIAGPGTFVNAAGRTTYFNTVTVNSPISNEGLLEVGSSSAINGALSTVASSTIRLASDGSTGNSTLTVANGFTNEGVIELSSTIGAYTAGLVVTSGTLVNAVGASINSIVGTGGARVLNAAVQNDGSINVLHPTQWIANNTANWISGALNITGGNLTVDQSGTALFTVAGPIDIGAGRTMTVNGGSLRQNLAGFTGTGPLNLTDVTVTGPGTFVNPAGRTLNLRNTTIDASINNLGLLHVVTPSVINGALSTLPGSDIRIETDGSAGTASLTVANGFLNNGDIELSSTAGAYTATLAVTAGTLENSFGSTIRTAVGAGGARNLVAQILNNGTMSIEQPTVWTAANIANENNSVIEVVGGNLTINQTGTASFTSDGNIDVAAGRVFRVSGGTFEQTGGGFLGSGEFDLENGTVIGSFFENPAGFSTRLRTATINADLSNFGSIHVVTTSSINGDIAAEAGSTIRIATDGSVGTTTLNVATGFSNAGLIELSSTAGAYTATLNLGGGTLTNSSGGIISVLRGTAGARSITGSVNNQGLLTMAGDGASILAISGGLTNSGTLTLELNGLAPGSGHDQITVGGLAVLGGSLNVAMFGGYVPVSGNSFTLITGGLPLTGLFSSTNLAAPLTSNPLYLLSSITVSVP